VMLSAEGEVKVMDFGTAKLLQQTNVQQLTMLGSMIGSAHYMSPEQVTETGVSGQSDQFSLGIIAYDLLAGRKPFEADSVPAILFQITAVDPPALSGIRTDLSKDVDKVFLRALAKKREDRYPTCAEFIRELRDALAKPAEPRPAAAAPKPSPAPAAPVAAKSAPAPPVKKAEPVSAGGSRTLMYVAIGVVVLVLIVIVAMVRR